MVTAKGDLRMSLYTVLVSDQPLPTIDCTGFEELTVREMKERYPITPDFPKQSWHLLDDDVIILNAPDESAFQKLHISEWDNYPSDLDWYNVCDYVYAVDGNWDEAFREAFLSYLHEHREALIGAELIQFWAGDLEQVLAEKRIVLADVTDSDLVMIKNNRNIRVQFE